MFADDAPDKKEPTVRFFQEIERGKHDIFISEAVRAEITAAPQEIRKVLFKAVRKYRPYMLEMDDEVWDLAETYVEHDILTRKHFTDLLHMAYASVHGMNALISWNLNHLVRMKTFTQGNAVNRANGYHEIMIFTPQQVIENDD